MIRLAIDTSTSTLSVALSIDGRVVDVTHADLGTGHAAHLASAAHTALRRHRHTLRDVDECVVSVGPGSFTGVRIALAYAKGLALGSEAALVPLLSPLGPAMRYHASERRMVHGVDGRKGQIFGTTLHCGARVEIVEEPRIYTPEDFFSLARAERARGAVMAGDAWTRYGDALEAFDPVERQEVAPEPSSDAAGLLHYRHVGGGGVVPAGDIEPRYLRASDAELGRRGGAPTEPISQ